MCFSFFRFLQGLRKSLEALTQEVKAMANALDSKIDDLKTQVAGLTTVVTSAAALIGGIGARIDAAVQAALAAGATADELQALTDLSAGIKSNADGLAAAVTANTPAPPA